MDLRLPSRARGASLVEYLLVVGLVALGALAAYSQFGASVQSLSGREAECVRTFSCGPGTDYPSAALPTEGAKATPAGDPLRAAWDNANGVLADAEDRVARAQAALEIAGGTRSRAPATPAIVAARAELAAAEQDASAAYASADAAGQAVLDRAYGDHYGFLARNWIDFKNTPSFVAGLGVGTYDGVVGMPAAIGATATAVWTWATTSAPPRDLVAERAQRIADRDAELSHELLRINDGAAANYEDGVWYGDKVLAGVVVGEGIGVAFKGAVGAGALVRTTETAEVAAADGSTFAARVTVVEGTPDALAGAAPRLTDAQRLRGKVATTPDGSSVLGPESAVAGRGVNFTSDNALIVGDPNAFVFGVHATRDSLSFYADVEGAVALSPRSVAVRMWRSGYRGGDIKLVACECGANPGLVTGLRRELNALELTSPVGTITAPTATVNGMGKLTAEGTWVEFRP